MPYSFDCFRVCNESFIYSRTIELLLFWLFESFFSPLFCCLICFTGYALRLTFAFAYSSSKVWAIADSKRQGFLGLTEFITAMQVTFILLYFIKKKTI